jgi:putative heme degradation protein
LHDTADITSAAEGIKISMIDVSWYAEASLVSSDHVYTAGSLAQCVRRWMRLTDAEQFDAFIKLHKATDGHRRMERDEIALLAAKPELAKV